jgi:hypothetical protein
MLQGSEVREHILPEVSLLGVNQPLPFAARDIPHPNWDAYKRKKKKEKRNL